MQSQQPPQLPQIQPRPPQQMQASQPPPPQQIQPRPPQQMQTPQPPPQQQQEMITPPPSPQEIKLQNDLPNVMINKDNDKLPIYPNYHTEKTNKPEKYTTWKIEYDGNSGYANLNLNDKIYKFKLNENNNTFPSLSDSNNILKNTQYLENNNNVNHHVNINDLAPSNSILLNNNGEIDNILLEESINKIKREINTISNYKNDLTNLNPPIQEHLIADKLKELQVNNLLNNKNTPYQCNTNDSNDNFMTDVVENVLQNMNTNNISKKETLPQHNTENKINENELFNNILNNSQGKNSPSNFITQQNDSIGLPELLIKHAIDNNSYKNRELQDKDSIFEFQPTNSPTNNNVFSYSPQDRMDELLNQHMFLSPNPLTNKFQEVSNAESPHDKIEKLLEEITIHKIESPNEQHADATADADAEKLFNINIFLEHLKTKKKNTKNKAILENIKAIEKILKHFKKNLTKNKNKITQKNKKIKLAKKNTTKTTNKPEKTNKKITNKTKDLEKKSKSSPSKTRSKRIKKEDNIFNNLLSNFTSK